MSQLRQMVNWKVWYRNPNSTKNSYQIVTSDQDSENFDENVKTLMKRIYPNAEVLDIEMISTSFLV